MIDINSGGIPTGTTGDVLNYAIISADGSASQECQWSNKLGTAAEDETGALDINIGTDLSTASASLSDTLLFALGILIKNP